MKLPPGMTVLGIDVSHHQGSVGWRGVAGSGAAFAFVQATDGATFVDPEFSSSWPAMKRAGLLRGAYHFFQPTADLAAQQALFLQTVQLEPGDLPPVLDIEVAHGASAGALLAGMKQWLEAVEQATGRTPIIYTSPGFWKQQLGDSPDFARYPLWIANYGVDQPDVPAAWSTWTFWQFSEKGTMEGVGGPVDLDTFHGSLDDLRAFASGGAAIQEGFAGPKVSELQQRLKDLGFDPGAIDGVFGPRTKAALRNFQLAKGLVADGIAGPKTLAALGLS
jgi:lysozyme